jgi:serine/threonine protein kinase
MRKFDDGDLYQYVTANSALPVSWIRSIARQILTALAAMHRVGWAHLDVGLESIYIEFRYGKSVAPEVFLSDFHRARRRDVQAGEKFTFDFVSPAYCAPEMTKYPPAYTEAVDMWAFGVTLYAMTVAAFPFPEAYDGTNLTREFKNAIKAGKYKKTPLKDVDPDLRKLIKKLLNPKPRKRYTADKALSHPFLSVELDVCRTVTAAVPEPEPLPGVT